MVKEPREPRLESKVIKKATFNHFKRKAHSIAPPKAPKVLLNSPLIMKELPTAQKGGTKITGRARLQQR